MTAYQLPTPITGVDSEQLLAELLNLYADRFLVKLHRAVAAGKLTEVVELLQEHPEHIDTPLLPVDCIDEMEKVNRMDDEAFLQFPGVVRQTTPYPPVLQFQSGVKEEPNELFPTGEYIESEKNLDTAFWSPLLRACHSGNTEIIRTLCEMGANKNFISPSNANALTVVLFSPFNWRGVAANLKLVATPENILLQDYFAMAVSLRTSPEIPLEAVQTLLELNCPLNRNSSLFFGDWKTWVAPEIVALVSSHFNTG